MDDALPVGIAERVGRLGDERQRLLQPHNLIHLCQLADSFQIGP